MTDADMIREALRYSQLPNDTLALAALDALVASRDTLERERDVALDRITSLEIEAERLRGAAQWLLENRGHRGEEQAWKLLVDATVREETTR